MSQQQVFPSQHGLETIGFEHRGRAFWNLSVPALVQESLLRGEGCLSHRGALITRTGERCGRSPKDKYTVLEPSSEKLINWGPVNTGIEEAKFDALLKHTYNYLAEKDIFVQDAYAGADPKHQFKVRVISEWAWHGLFTKQALIRPKLGDTVDFLPDLTVVCAPECKADPEKHGVNSTAYVIINFAKNIVLIGGTGYAGEIKKSIFTALNYLLPAQGVCPMHCSANIGPNNDTALFFGLSGTGKTTLSADPKRRLIGDDEHGWSDDGVFNFEGGCYAKVIRLSAEHEPQIYDALKFGAIVENVICSETTHTLDLDDASITENTRAVYPLHYISNAQEPSIGDHPKSVVFLACDAFGVLPPVSRLTPEQAMYHFLSGYTAKVAGTEAGLGDEPQATFSSCFGEPFLPLVPGKYAELLGKRVAENDSRVWLVNTGWSGGPNGVGHRFSLPHTRAIIQAALAGELDNVEYRKDPVFGFEVPTACPNVPSELLNPRFTWEDKDAYDAKAKELAKLFIENFEKLDGVAEELKAAGPTL